MDTIVVTAAIIEKEGKFLLAQRKENTSQGLKWEFPGGKIEFGETPEQCLVREIQEELNIIIEVKEIFDVVSHVYGEKQIILLCYKCSYVGGELKLNDCHDYEWVLPQNLLNYDLALADIPVAQKLAKAFL